MRTTASCLCVSLLVLVVAGYAEPPPEIPATPAAVKSILYARPFALRDGFAYHWCKERPNVKEGMLLVLEVDPALVVPRAIATPVLYVGDQVAERVNAGDKCGRVIALVPGHVDLAQSPIWFGRPGLPDQVDSARIKQERGLADAAGIKPLPEKSVAEARAKGGSTVKAVDKSALLRGPIAELIIEYCPEEKHLADDFRVPVVQKRPAPPADPGD
jgi:hypothetical protein